MVRPATSWVSVGSHGSSLSVSGPVAVLILLILRSYGAADKSTMELISEQRRSMDQVSVTRHVADRIRTLRAQRRWSAQRLADECERLGMPTLSRSAIAKVESGHRRVTADELDVLARVLETTPDTLMTAFSDDLPTVPETTPRSLNLSRLDVRRQLVDNLVAASSLQSRSGLELFTDLLIEVFGGPLPLREHAGVRLRMVELVRSCTDLPGGAVALAEALEILEPGSDHTLKVRELAAQYETVNTPHSLAGPTHATVTVQVQHHAQDQGAFVVSHWLRKGLANHPSLRGEDRVARRDDLEQLIGEIITAAETAWSDWSGEVRVEFVLPLDLINLPVDRWRVPELDVPLGVQYPVVVRSLERMRAQNWHRVWRSRWRHLAAEPGASLVLRGDSTDKPDSHGFARQLHADPRYVGMVLSEPPVRADGQGVTEMTQALRAGLPFLVWSRDDCHAPTFRDAVAELLGDGELADLPERVRDMRRRAETAPTGDGDTGPQHLAVLWDDPDQLVY
jgi:transcriptional regulator with XRE-family HTH domain